MAWKNESNKKLGYVIIKVIKGLYLKYAIEYKRKYNNVKEVRIIKVKKECVVIYEVIL